MERKQSEQNATQSARTQNFLMEYFKDSDNDSDFPTQKPKSIELQNPNIVFIGGNISFSLNSSLTNLDKRKLTRFQIEYETQEGKNKDYSIWQTREQGTQQSFVTHSVEKMIDRSDLSGKKITSHDEGDFQKKDLHDQSLLAQYGFKYIQDAKLQSDKRLKKIMKEQKKKKKRQHRSKSISDDEEVKKGDIARFDFNMLKNEEEIINSRKRDKKRKDKKKKKSKKKNKRSRSSSTENDQVQQDEEDDDVGPQLPENFYEEIQMKEEMEKEAIRLRNELLMQSYKRPRRQKVQEVMHPSDEKKILAQISFKEQQRRETTIRAEMKKLMEDAKKSKSNQLS